MMINRKQKTVGILQLTMAAIAVIWLLLLGIIPTTITLKGEMAPLWPLFVFPILYALPCIPFIIANIATGVSNILRVRKKAKSYKRICIAKFIYNLIALVWPTFFFFVISHTSFTSIISGYLWPTYVMIVLSCILFVFEMSYVNKKHAEESILNLNKALI